MSNFFKPSAPNFSKDAGRKGQLRMFKPNVSTLYTSAKKQISGRILPGFDFSLSVNDGGFKSSVCPYRDKNAIDPETKLPAIQAFFIQAYGYKFFGKNSEAFLSPSTRRYLTDGDASSVDAADPIEDIRHYVFKHPDPAVQALAKRPEGQKLAKAVVPKMEALCLYNFYGNNGSSSNKNAILPLSRQGGSALMELLDQYKHPQFPALDSDWPAFLLGDVTHPTKGLTARIAQYNGKDSGITFFGFQFTPNPKTPEGAQVMPVDESVLKGRYNLWSEQETLEIYSYQRLVDFIVSDASIPYEHIQAACSDRANVPASPKQNVGYSIPSAPTPYNPTPIHKEDEIDYGTDSDDMSKTAEAPAEDEFYISVNGAVDPQTKPSGYIRRLITNGSPPPMLMPADQSQGWNTPEHFGIVVTPVPPAARPAPAPPAPAAPPAPPAPTPSSTPAPQAPEAGSKLSEAEAARFAELGARDRSTFGTHELVEFVNLTKKSK